MKRIVFSCVLLGLIAAIGAYPVLITSWDLKSDLRTLQELQTSVDRVDWTRGRIVADVWNDEEFDTLLAHGLAASKLPDIARENALKLHQDKSLDPPRDEYYTIDQYQQFMVSTAAQYPNICQLVSAGNSTQNRPLYFLKITDNPTLEETEPEFKYISSIHGNEVVGYDMCIRLIQQLTSEYGTNTRITNLVNSTEIWICPLMNPDGFVLGQRQNAAGIDLNRNFPMPTGVQHPDGNNWAPETLAMIDLFEDHSFTLSANFHCGTLVMNYPWDYTYALAPDDALLQEAALTYSIHNSPMYNSNEFDDGITNGAAWYVITGSMQDWNYFFTDDTDITAEISEEYWPPASTLPTFWSQNQESMLSYLEFVHRGIHGTVTSEAGAPLAASVTVQGNTKIVTTDPDAGDYHRLLLPGSYSITVQADGYIPQTDQVTVPASGSTTRDFVLLPAQAVDFYGQARNLQGIGMAGIEVALDTNPVQSVITDVAGSFQFAGITEGIYQLTFSSQGSVVYQTDFLLTAQQNRQVFTITEPAVLLNDPCNNILNWTATSPWAVTTYQGESVIADSPAGNYANNVTRSLRLTSPISLQNITDPHLEFKTVYDLENGYDFVLIQASTTTNNWTTLGSVTGTQSSWQNLSYSLQQFAGQSVYVRFVIDTDWSQTADGIYLDDIRIQGTDAGQIIYGDADGDKCVTRSDAQAVLDYNVGLDPLPDTDPRPWDANRVAACDVDADQLLSSADAYLIMQYILNPAFRFETQSGEEAVFTPVTVTATPLPNAPDIHYYLTFEPQGQLKCFDFQLNPTDQVDLTELQLIPYNEGLASSNTLENRFAWISLSAVSLQQLHLYYQTSLASTTLNYTANGASGTLNLLTGTASEDPSVPQTVFSLAQNYPNPFFAQTGITFSLAQDKQQASLRIYNCKGQLVRTLVEGVLNSGSQSLVWDGLDQSGNAVTSGIYLYRLQSGAQSLTRRMILIK